MSCDKIREDNISFADCDSTCEERKRQIEEENQKKIQKQLELEEEKNRRELEEYEKKFGPKKYKERKQRHVEEEKSNKSLIIIALSAFIAAIFAIVLYFFVI